jgi:hypothetical protein
MSLTPATSFVTLSRGGVLVSQREEIAQGVTVNRIIIEESRGDVAKFCAHWLDQLLRERKTQLAEQLHEIRPQFSGSTTEALSGNGPIGFFSVHKLTLHQYVRLDFHVTRPLYASAYVGIGNLGTIKQIQAHNPRALPRTKRRQLL